MKKILSILMAALFLFASFALTISAAADEEIVDVTNPDDTSIEYDFGKVLTGHSVDDYPCNMDKDIEIAAFLEHGYNTADFKIYFYIYNPKMKNINFEGSNYLQLHSPVLGESYKKLSFNILSTYGATAETEHVSNALLLKCKLNINQDNIDRTLTDVERSYHVSGIELDTSIKSNDVYVSSEANKLTLDKTFTDCDVLRINIPTGQESLSITQQGINLLDPSLYLKSTYAGITLTPNGDEINMTGTANRSIYIGIFNSTPDGNIAVPDSWKNKTITMAVYCQEAIDIRSGFVKPDGTTRWCNLTPSIGTNAAIILTNDEQFRSVVRFTEGNTYNLTFKLMVVEGNQNLAYEPYVVPITYELPAEACIYDSIELNKVSNRVFAYSNNQKINVSGAAWAQELMKFSLYEDATTVLSSSEGVTFSAADIDESKYGVKDYVVDTTYLFRENNGFLYQTIEYPDNVIETQVVHTYYRIQSEQLNKYYDIRTVAFNVPNAVVEEYDNLTAIEATWKEFTTTPILTVDNKDIYQAFLEVENKEVTDFAYGFGQNMHYEMYNWPLELAGLLTGLFWATNGSFVNLYSFENFYNPSVLNEWYILDSKVDLPAYWLYGQNMYDNSFNKIDYVFLNENPNAWEDENILYSAEQLENKVDGYGWKADVFQGDPVSFGSPEEPIKLEADKVTMLDKYKVNSLLEIIFGKPTAFDMIIDYSCIEPIKEKDFALGDVEFSAKYLIEQSDVSDIKALQNEDYTTYLFRYTVTDYTSENVSMISNHRMVSCQANLSQSVAIKDFDMITSHWSRDDGKVFIIPFVSDPTNAFVDGTSAVKPQLFPNEFNDMWDKLRDILTIILVVLIVALVVFVVVKAVGFFADMRIAFGNYGPPKNSNNGRKKK